MRTLLAAGTLAGLALTTTCAHPECSRPDYRLPECRVILENELARLRTPAGTEVRFQDPAALTSETWDARGLLAWRVAGGVHARVAGLGGFALSLDDAQPGLVVHLTNVDPRAVVEVHGASGVRTVEAFLGTLGRSVELTAADGPQVWIRGSTPCAPRYRLAITADIQTNPGQFRRLVERLSVEALEGERSAEPLMGLLIAGDLSEWSRDEEFEHVESLSGQAVVPVAVTTGNHDTFDRSRPFYSRRFGPGNHVFEICDTRVAMLDSGSGMLAASVEGRVPELLDRGGARHLLLGLHHPPFAALTGAGWTNEERAQWLLAEAALAGVDLIFTGHKHELRSYGDIDVGGARLWQIIVGTAGADQGLDLPRYGYVRLTLGPEGREACFVEVPPGGAAEALKGGVPGLPACP